MPFPRGEARSARSPRVGLTANFGTYVTAIGDVELDGAVIDDVIATLYEAGIAVTIR